MFEKLRKTSLRARLFWLTALAFAALLIALISAFRTAQTSAAFAERRVEINVGAAAREIFVAARGSPLKNYRIQPSSATVSVF